MNVETIYKTSEEKFVAEYVMYLKDVPMYPGTLVVYHTYADPECTIPVFSEQFHEMMHNNVRLVFKRTIKDGFAEELFTYLSSGRMTITCRSKPEGSLCQIAGIISVGSDVETADIVIASLPQELYEMIFGGTMPMPLNEDDEPVSAMEALHRLFVAYIAYLEDQNDAE